MLQLLPNCECCDCDLPADSADARICSFECTYCARLGQRCPNCGGELQPRPRRPLTKLERYPASTERVVKANGCH